MRSHHACMVTLPSTTTLLTQTPLVRALHTQIRNKDSDRRTFVTNSDRLVQLLVEESLALLPATPVTVTTPCGAYEGVSLPDESLIVCVSILRAADCMLGVVRQMMPSVAVGASPARWATPSHSTSLPRDAPARRSCRLPPPPLPAPPAQARSSSSVTRPPQGRC